MGNWAEWPIKHKQVVMFFAVLITLLGIFSYQKVGRQEDPDFAMNAMAVSAAWPGATAKQMETQVTDKIEKVIQTVPDIDFVQSYSRPGECVITVTLMSSWLVAATVSPVLAYHWIKPSAKYESAAPGENPMYQNAFYRIFRSFLNWSLAHKATTLLVTAAVFISVLFLGRLVKEEFFPESVRQELMVEMNLPEGSSLAASDEAARTLTELIMKDTDDVEKVAAYVGRSVPRFVLALDPTLPRSNYAQLVVIAKDAEARERVSQKVFELVDSHMPQVEVTTRVVPLGPPSPYPIMLTPLTPVLGLIPMFPSGFWRGMAIAIASGLTVATMITLIVLPSIYCLVFKIKED